MIPFTQVIVKSIRLSAKRLRKHITPRVGKFSKSFCVFNKISSKVIWFPQLQGLIPNLTLNDVTYYVTTNEIPQKRFLFSVSTEKTIILYSLILLLQSRESLHRPWPLQYSPTDISLPPSCNPMHPLMRVLGRKEETLWMFPSSLSSNPPTGFLL